MNIPHHIYCIVSEEAIEDTFFTLGEAEESLSYDYQDNEKIVKYVRVLV